MSDAERFAHRLRDAIEAFPALQAALNVIARYVARDGPDAETMRQLDRLAIALIERDPELAPLGAMGQYVVLAALAQSVGIDAELVAVAVQLVPAVERSRLN